MVGMLTCNKCKEIKTRDDFFIRKNGNIHTPCKNCRKISYSKYRKNNLVKFRSYSATAKAKRKMSAGTHTPKDIAALYKKCNGKCTYCSINLDEKYAVDHIIPLSRGGTNYPINLQILCIPCNASKHAKNPELFEMEKSIFGIRMLGNKIMKVRQSGKMMHWEFIETERF